MMGLQRMICDMREEALLESCAELAAERDDYKAEAHDYWQRLQRALADLESARAELAQLREAAAS